MSHWFGGEQNGERFHVRQLDNPPTAAQEKKWKLYPKADGWYVRSDSGIELKLSIDQSPSSLRPGRIMLGNILNYPNQGSVDTASDIQYTQIFLIKDQVLDRMEAFISSGATGDVRFGLYDQSDPDDFEGDPDARVSQTNPRTLVGGDDGTFVIESLTSAFTVPATGFYWVAMIADNTNPKFQVSDVFSEDYPPRRIESGSGTTLPATAGTITNPEQAIAYVAAVIE